MEGLLLRVQMHPFRALLPKIAELVLISMVCIVVLLAYLVWSKITITLLLIILLVLGVAVFITAISLMYYFVYAKYHYDFYTDCVELCTAYKHTLPYDGITTVSYERNENDNIRGTWTILLHTRRGIARLRYVEDDYALFSQIVGFITHYQEQVMGSSVDEQKAEAFATLFTRHTDEPTPKVKRELREESVPPPQVPGTAPNQEQHTTTVPAHPARHAKRPVIKKRRVKKAKKEKKKSRKKSTSSSRRR